MLLPYISQQVDKVIARMAVLGHPMKVSSSYRTWAEQDHLYAQGRTIPGHIVTNARGGESFHNYKVAADLCFTTGDAFGNDQPWSLYGQVARYNGFTWGGDWSTFKDRPHIQITFGQNEFQLKKLGETAALQLLLTLSNKLMDPTPALAGWQETAIKFAQDTGISDGSRPLETATRVEMMEMLRKMYVYLINKK